MDVPQEELHACQPLHSDWPVQGNVEFERVTLRYMPSSPAALRDVSFNIAAGTQVSAHVDPNLGKLQPFPTKHEKITENISCLNV